MHLVASQEYERAPARDRTVLVDEPERLLRRHTAQDRLSQPIARAPTAPEHDHALRRQGPHQSRHRRLALAERDLQLRRRGDALHLQQSKCGANIDVDDAIHE